ncbi:hypothetical protein SteCoe_31229 [Stentor coeruleus]|uniref:Uncharacterized protein n=1 Tax=Stentor coeruleus TaxID=5963 RepID=A0A1R2B1V3_9CILI|nr:hypothetical protein SteCoe_31229 [Stentor coeruleus]
MNDLEQAKVVLLGDANSGKTSILQRYIGKTFNNHSSPTIGSTYLTKIVDFNRKSIKLCIWDTAGQERYYSLAPSYAREAKVCMLVYDITSKDSFYNLDRWYNCIKDHLAENVIIVIVGNKHDLESKEAVPVEEVKNFAEIIGAMYMRTSAKCDTGIEEMFIEICRELVGNDSIQKMPTYRSANSVKLEPVKIEMVKKKKKCCK